MNDIIKFCEETIEILKESDDFAVDYVRRKIEFFHKFQTPFIFSTRFGAEFFHQVHKYLVTEQNLKPDPGQILGEYDDNFNKWLKKVRSL